MKSKLQQFVERIANRLRGYKKVSDIKVEGVSETNGLYVKDEMLPKIREYLKKHHLAIMGILIAVIVVPWGVRLSNDAEVARIESQPRTTTYYFTPSNKVELALVEDVASCWQSIASLRSDAYRCSLNDEIIDPCFRNSIADYVDCPSSPEEHRILTVAEYEITSRTNENIESTPWFIKLEDGSVCRFITGATAAIGGGRVDYGCDNQHWLSLPVNMDEEVYTIKCYVKNTDRIELCGISEAWY